jgi:hypothetical protein
MKKIILQFNSLADVAAFSKTLDCGYMIDTSALTVSGKFSAAQVSAAQQAYGVVPMTAEVARPEGGRAGQAYTLQSFI